MIAENGSANSGHSRYAFQLFVDDVFAGVRDRKQIQSRKTSFMTPVVLCSFADSSCSMRFSRSLFACSGTRRSPLLRPRSTALGTNRDVGVFGKRSGGDADLQSVGHFA